MTETSKPKIGKIIHVDLEKGYGFIVSKEIPFTRIFFLWTGLKPETINFLELKKGMEVEFQTIDVPDKGLRAIKIDVLEDESNEHTKEGLKG